MFANGGMSAQANCSNKNVSLYLVAPDGSINYSTPARSVTLENDGTFKFKNLKSVGINPKTEKVTYLLRVEACGENYSRPLTGLRDQDITVSSSVIEKINSADSVGMKKLSSLEAKDVDTLMKSVNLIEATTISQAYDSILANSLVKTNIQNLFDVTYEDVKDLTPPDIQSLSLPLSYAEASQASFAVVASHWYKSFLFAYEWNLNGTVVSHSASYSFVPTKNYQGTHALVLKVGVDDGSGNVDVTKPYVTQNMSISIPNTFPAIVPALTLTSSSPTNSLNASLALATGSNLVNCDTFSTLGLTENVATSPLSPSSYPINCSSPNSQSIPYTLTSGDGLKTLRLWAIDSAGNFSTSPQTVNVLLDQTPPSVFITPVTGVLKGGNSYTLNFVVSDATSGINSASLYYAQDGSTFVSVADIKGLSSYNWSIPLADVSTAKFKIIATDKAGNSTVLATNAFTIDSTAPTVAITSPVMNSSANIANVASFAISGSCSEEGRNIAISGAASATTTCTSGTWAVNLNLSAAPQGSLAINATQSDVAGNSTTTSITYIKDTIAPSLVISSPVSGSYINASNVGVTTVSGTCSESSQSVTFSGAATGTVACISGSFSKSLNFSGAAEGAVTLTASITDVAGNTTATSKNYVKDTILPTLTLVSTSGIDINNSNYSNYGLNGTCSENGMSVSVTADGSIQTATCSSGTWSLAFDFTGSPQGAVSVIATINDAAGNTNTANLSLNKNTTIPTLGITTPVANSYANISNVSAFVISGNCSAIGQAVNITAPVSANNTCSVGGTWSVTLDLSSLPQGDFTIAYNHTDTSNNTVSKTRTYKKDTLAPTAAISSPSANSYINVGNVASYSVSGSCSEETRSITITGDANGTATCTSGAWTTVLNFTSATEGTVNITATHADLAGNSVTDARAFIKDTTAPTLAINSPAAGSYVNAANVSTFAVNGTCSENTRNIMITGDATATFTCSSGAWSGNLNFSSAPQGTLNISIAHADAAGNTTTVARSFVKDTVPPTLAITSPTSGSYVNASTVSSYTVNGTCSENGQAINITGSLTSSSTCSAGVWNKTLDFSGISDGAITLTAGIVDVAGNAMSTSINLTKDTVLPSLSLTSFTGGQVIAGGSIANITWSGSDNNTLPTSPMTIDYSTNSGSTWLSVIGNIANTGTYSWTVPVITSDNVRFRITLKDTAGNITTATSSSDFSINSTSPTITLTSMTGNQYLAGGSTQNITWSANGNHLGASPIKIEISSDSGSTWSTLIAATTNSGTYSWSIPTVDSSTYRVRATVTDQSNLIASSASSTNITLDNTNPTLTIVKPTSTDIIAGGSTFYVNWTASDTNFGSTPLKFEYSTDGGTTWTNIVASYANAGNYAWIVPSLNSSNVTLRATATDLALRQKQVVSGAFTIDSTPPTAPSVSLASAAVTNSTTVSVNVTCIADYAKILITENTTAPLASDPSWQTCSSPKSFTIIAGDGNHTLKVWSKDLAGNISLGAGSAIVTLDQTSPTLSLNTNFSGLILKGGATQSIAWTAADANFGVNPILLEYSSNNGSSWSSIGTVANSSPYTWTVPSVSSTQMSIKVTASDSAGNPATSVTTAVFTVDSTAPVVGQFKANGATSSTVTSNNVPITLQASDNLLISAFCLKYNDSTTPTSSDGCWIPLQNVSLAPTSNLNLSNYYFRIGFGGGTYIISAWTKDQAGNISSLSSTPGIDNATVTYSPGTPPTISQILAANSDSPSSPLSSSDLIIPAGQSVYIKWQASDSNTLPASAIQLFYTTDDINWTSIGTFNNSQGSGCSLTGSLTGCYVWTNASPTSSYFKVRMKVTNSGSSTSQLNSLSLNVSAIKFIAGNTEPGIGGSASSGVFINTPTNDVRQGDIHSLVVHPSGTIYFKDVTRGLIKVDPSSGLMSTFIPIGTSITDGALSGAKVKSLGKIALDYQNNLLLWDQDRIRKVDLTAGTVTTFLGGGASTADTVAAPLSLKILAPSPSLSSSYYFQPMPNGDIIMNSDCNYCSHIRWYHAADQSSTSIYLNGAGIPGYPGIDVKNCPAPSAAPILDASNNIQGFIANYYTTPSGLCSYDGGYHGYIGIFDSAGNFLNTIALTTPVNASWLQIKLGADLKVYIVNKSAGYLSKYNPTTQTITALNNGLGYSPDGTNLTTAKMTPEDIFVTSSGKFYFPENGTIRTVTDSGTILTIAGQPLNYGDGLDPLLARFGNLNAFGLWNNGSDDLLVVLDAKESYLKEINLNSKSIQSIAGNGVPGFSSTSLPALGQSFLSLANNIIVSHFGLDALGNVYHPYTGSQLGMLNRSTGKWQVIAGGGSTMYNSADGLAGASIKYNNTSGLVPVLGYGNGKVVIGPGVINGTYTDYPYFKMIDTTTTVQSTLAGINVTGSTYSTWCADGTALNTCPVPVNPGNVSAKYDSQSGAWYVHSFVNTAIKKLMPGGNMVTYINGPTGTIGNFAYRRYDSTTEYFYYCNTTTGIIHKILMTNGSLTSNTAFPWPISSMSCTGFDMIYNSNRGSLIFAYSQNGMLGIAEYLNP